MACGFWLRYPNPHSSHVLTEDVITREFRDGNKLYTKRLLTKTNSLPNWGRQFFSSKDRVVCVIEESLFDSDAQTFTTRTRNVGFTTKILDVVETVVYNRDKNNGNLTTADRQATLSSHFLGLAYALEQFGIRRFKKNCETATNGFLYVLNNLYAIATQKNVLGVGTNVEIGGKGISSTAIGITKTKVGNKLNEAKENLKKAKHLAKKSGLIVLAENDK